VAGDARGAGVSRVLGRRVVTVDRVGGERWRTLPEPVELRLDLLTPAELEHAEIVRERLDAVGLADLRDDDLDFCLCLHERLSGERDEPCVAEGG
jgi:hypothetical protein